MRFVYFLFLTTIFNIILIPAYAANNTHNVINIPDFSEYKNVKQKKSAFFDFMRKIIKTENNRILLTRNKLKSLQKKKSISTGDKLWISKIAKKYNVVIKHHKDKKMWKEFLARVDIVPLELAMAQSANESRWGTSRFALKGRNFFGQWCFRKGCGLVPKRRDKGAAHEVAVFKTVNDSVAAYIHNLNTGRVYAGLRNIRQQLRAKNKQPEAIAMAAGLSKYSIRRMAYVKEIRSMIRYNRKLMIGS